MHRNARQQSVVPPRRRGENNNRRARARAGRTGARARRPSRATGRSRRRRDPRRGVAAARGRPSSAGRLAAHRDVSSRRRARSARSARALGGTAWVTLADGREVVLGPVSRPMRLSAGDLGAEPWPATTLWTREGRDVANPPGGEAPAGRKRKRAEHPRSFPRVRELVGDAVVDVMVAHPDDGDTDPAAVPVFPGDTERLRSVSMTMDAFPTPPTRANGRAATTAGPRAAPRPPRRCTSRRRPSTRPTRVGPSRR